MSGYSVDSVLEVLEQVGVCDGGFGAFFAGFGDHADDSVCAVEDGEGEDCFVELGGSFEFGVGAEGVPVVVGWPFEAGDQFVHELDVVDHAALYSRCGLA